MTNYKFFILIVSFILLISPVNSLITIEDKGTDYIFWSWNNTGVDSISVDSITVSDYDLSNSYILSNIEPDSIHQIKLFNNTSGQLDSNATKSLAMTETAQEGFFSLANLYLLFLIGLICVIAGALTNVPIISLAGGVIGITGIVASFNHSFGLGFLFFILMLAGILEGVSSLLS